MTMSGSEVRAAAVDAATRVLVAAIGDGRAPVGFPLSHQVVATARVLEAYIALGELPEGVEDPTDLRSVAPAPQPGVPTVDLLG
jgi:hypothetical protein